MRESISILRHKQDIDLAIVMLRRAWWLMYGEDDDHANRCPICSAEVAAQKDTYNVVIEDGQIGFRQRYTCSRCNTLMAEPLPAFDPCTSALDQPPYDGRHKK